MFDIGKILTAPISTATRAFEDPVSMLNPINVVTKDMGFGDEEDEEEVDANGRGKDGFIEVAYRQPEEVTESTNELSSD